MDSMDRQHEEVREVEWHLAWRALFRGFEALERELHMHIHLENNILFPKALALQP